MGVVCAVLIKVHLRQGCITALVMTLADQAEKNSRMMLFVAVC